MKLKDVLDSLNKVYEKNGNIEVKLMEYEGSSFREVPFYGHFISIEENETNSLLLCNENDFDMLFDGDLSEEDEQ